MINKVTDAMLEPCIEAPDGRTYSFLGMMAVVLRHQDEEITDKLFKKSLIEPSSQKRYSPLEVEATMLDAWSNEACLGYIILALEALDYSEEAIKQVVTRLKLEEFDFKTAEEAVQHYKDSSY